MHRFSLRNIRQLSTSIASKTLHYREAIVSDALQIMSCNRRNLPENYSFEFFENHLELWPDLSLVAENDNEIIGYVLARIESNSTHQHREMLHQSSTTCAAHIMSIAIDSAYRRRGTALLMMEAIHQKAFQNNKVSNTSATRLYQQSLGYKILQVLPNYYADGEAANFMVYTRM